MLVDRFELTHSASHAAAQTASDHNWWASLFEPEPEQWGLRGDPYAWRALSAAVTGQPKPPGPIELQKVLRQAFAQVVGVDLNEPGQETVSVPALAHGGMVQLPTWRDSLVPLLIAVSAPQHRRSRPEEGVARRVDAGVAEGLPGQRVASHQALAAWS